MKHFLILIITTCLFAGCAPSDSQASNLARKEATLAAAASTSIAGSGSATQVQAAGIGTPAAEDQLVKLARAELAARLGIGIERVSLVSIAQLATADIYSGCTRKLGQAAMPDQSINGYQIWLQAGGQRYVYHAEMPNVIIACERAALPGNRP